MVAVYILRLKTTGTSITALDVVHLKSAITPCGQLASGYKEVILKSDYVITGQESSTELTG